MIVDAGFLTPWLNMGVSGAFLAITWIIVTRLLPAAFDRIIQEFATQREEFLANLKVERETRQDDRAKFLDALSQQRTSSDHQLTVMSAGLQRLEAKLETAMVQLTQQMGQLTAAVNLLLKDRTERENG